MMSALIRITLKNMIDWKALDCEVIATAKDGEEAPEGWTVWRIPGYEYLYVKCTEEDILPR